MEQTNDPIGTGQADCVDIYRVTRAALGRADRLRSLSNSVRAVAGLFNSIGPAAVLTMAADELAQLAGGAVE